MNQQRQHAVIKMDITLNLLQKYHRPHIPETGKEIQYDIQQLRGNPNTLKLWFKQRTEQEETNQEINNPKNLNTTNEQWGKLKQKIHSGLKECYPINVKFLKQKQSQTIHEKWATSEEKTQHNQLQEQTKITQKQINALGKKRK